MTITHRSVVAARTRRSFPSAQAQLTHASKRAVTRNDKSSRRPPEKRVAIACRSTKLAFAFIAWTFLGVTIAAAEPLETAALNPCTPVVCEVSPTRVLPLAPPSAPPRYDLDTPEDIMAGRGRQRLSSALAQIAIYASIGNRDAVEISANRLQKEFGVSREEIEEAITWSKTHPHR
jgi:hypothetical protein